MTGDSQSREAAIEHDLLTRIAAALEPYLGEIVLCGGWVPYLYWARIHDPIREPPLRTQDADFAVPRHLPVIGGQPIADCLLATGARTRLAGYGEGIVRFEIDHGDATVPIEFITPLVGDGRERQLEVQKGLRIEPLRYVDLLLERTEHVLLVGDVAGVRKEATVRVPAPGMFVAQKILTARRRRDRSRRGKDLAYVRDILANYDELHPVILDDVEWLRQRWPRWFTNFRDELQRLFQGERPLGCEWMISVAYPEGLPEALPREAALHELAEPFLEFVAMLPAND